MPTIHAHGGQILHVVTSLVAAAFLLSGMAVLNDPGTIPTAKEAADTGSGYASGASTRIGTDADREVDTGADTAGGPASGAGTGKGAKLVFGDECSSLRLHRTWQAGDKWELISPSSPDGRGGPKLGECGDMWWTNPFNPRTPIQGLYSCNTGQMVLGLAAVPGACQSYIDNEAGKHLPYAGTLINSARTCYRLYGYWEVSVAVDNVAGFSFQACLESWEKTGKWPPEIDVRVTDSRDGAQEVMFQFYDKTLPGWRQWKSTSFDCAKTHSYGIEWRQGSLAFYVDRKQVWQASTPNDGSYSSHPCFWYVLTGANYENNGDPNMGSLPCYPRVDAIKVWDKRPW